ncbi:MAG: LacI family transcriptional regulator [Opitutaceae bacterium]|nr:LacI family transcriptional regulator [Opitutaceae bacterium]
MFFLAPTIFMRHSQSVNRSSPAALEKPTILDVAAVAKVAVGTVSRVINTPDAVGPGIRQRVLEAIASTNYKPLRRRRKANSLDGGTPRRNRGNFGVLLIGMDDSLAHLPVIAEALHGVELAMAIEGMNLMLANVPNADRIPAFLAKNQVDGLILKSPLLGDLSTCASPALVDAIRRLPHVWLLGKPESADGDMCGTDADAGARIAAEYLRARGHRNISYLHPRPGQTRAEGLKRSISLHLQRLGMQLTFLENPTVENVRWPLPAITNPRDIAPLLERWESMPAVDRPTALVVSADSIAVQLYHALHEKGLRVGRDVSLLSFNHERALVMGLTPALTTIDIRAEAIGRRAVEQLLWRIRNRTENTPTKILVEPCLVEGDSVATLAPSV